MGECKYCQPEYNPLYNPNEFHNTRKCYEFQCLVVESLIEDNLKVLRKNRYMKESYTYEDLMVPHEDYEIEKVKDKLTELFDYQEELRLNPEPIIPEPSHQDLSTILV